MAKRSVGVSNDDFAINNIGDVVSSVEFHTLNQEKEISGVNYYLFKSTKKFFCLNISYIAIATLTETFNEVV